MSIKVTTVNVNGIRAAYRKGMDAWLATEEPDVVLLQEVRAPDEIVHQLMGDGWHVVHQACTVKGRAGVAIASRRCALAMTCKSAATSSFSLSFCQYVVCRMPCAGEICAVAIHGDPPVAPVAGSTLGAAAAPPVYLMR